MRVPTKVEMLVALMEAEAGLSVALQRACLCSKDVKGLSCAPHAARSAARSVLVRVPWGERCKARRGLR